jgi:multiple sugar transport system substrate-binding protein
MSIFKLGPVAALALALTSGVVLPNAAWAETIEFSTWQAEEGGFGVFWNESVEAFEAANPDTQIDIVQIPYGDYINQLTIRFASGRPPALIELPSEFMGIFAAQDWFAPLDERIAGTPIADQWASVQSEMTWDGETIGTLMMGGAYVLFYNEALLAEAGIEPPTSYEDYLAKIGEFTDRDAGIFGLSSVTAQHPTIALDLMRTFAWSDAALIVDGGYNLTSPETIAALDQYRDVRVANSALGADSSMSRQQFFDGKSAFMVDGPWVYSSVSEAPDDVRPNLKIMQTPFDVAVGGAVNSMHIAAAASPEQQDAAWAYIEFISSEEWQQRWAELTVSPPAMVGAITPELVERQPMLQTISEAVDDVESAWPSDEGIRSNLNEFRDILTRMGVRLLSSQDPTETIAAETQAELERTFPLN